MQIRISRLACLAAPALVCLPAAAQGSIVGLGTTGIRASGMSTDGSAIAGYSSVAHYWTSANPTFLSTGGGAGSEVKTSNGALFLSSDEPDPANGNKTTAARWDASQAQWSVLPSLGAASGNSVSTAYDISADGQKVVGLAWSTAGTAHAFEWTPAGGTVDLGLQLGTAGNNSRANGVSADGSTVVGWFGGSHRAARWSGGTGSYLGASLDPSNPVFGGGECYGASGDGTYICGTSVRHGFVWDAAHGMTDLGLLPNMGAQAQCIATSVSDDGRTVVGWSGNNFIDAKAVIWRQGMSQVEDLQTYLASQGIFDALNWTLRMAVDVSGDGQKIAGWGLNLGGQVEGFLVVLPPQITNYCTAGTTSHNCVPAIAGVGVPSASAGSGFTIAVSQVEGQQSGVIFYGISGQVAFPWGASTSFMCIKSPIERTPVQNSGGTFSACDGTLSLDWNAYIANNPGALGNPFSSGTAVQSQAWFRDPPSPKTTMLSGGLEFVVLP